MKSVHIKQAFLQHAGTNLEHIQDLLDLIPDVAFFVKDRKGRFVMQNRRAYESCGETNEAATLGKTDRDFFPADRAATYMEGDQRVMTSGEPIVNALCPAPDATDKLIVYSKVPVRADNGKIIGVAGIHRIIDNMRNTPAWHGSFATAIDYLHLNYATPLKISDLAQRAGISRRQFERRFEKLFGCDPKTYLLRVRISAARDLLEKTDRTLTDIAVAVGFYDHSHFTKAFKQLMDCTPHAYRKQRQQPLV